MKTTSKKIGFDAFKSEIIRNYDGRRKNTIFGGMTRAEYNEAMEKRNRRQVMHYIASNSELSYYKDSKEFLELVLSLDKSTLTGMEDYCTSVKLLKDGAGVVALCPAEKNNSISFRVDDKYTYKRMIARHFIKVLAND